MIVLVLFEPTLMSIWEILYFVAELFWTNLYQLHQWEVTATVQPHHVYTGTGIYCNSVFKMVSAFRCFLFIILEIYKILIFIPLYSEV